MLASKLLEFMIVAIHSGSPVHWDRPGRHRPSGGTAILMDAQTATIHDKGATESGILANISPDEIILFFPPFTLRNAAPLYFFCSGTVLIQKKGVR